MNIKSAAEWLKLAKNLTHDEAFAFAAWLDNQHQLDTAETYTEAEIREVLDFNWRGTFETVRDYADELADDVFGLRNDDRLAMFFDYDKHADYLTQWFDVLEVEDEHGHPAVALVDNC